MGRGDAVTGAVLGCVPVRGKEGGGRGTDGGGAAAMIVMTTNVIIGRCCPNSWRGGDHAQL